MSDQEYSEFTTTGEGKDLHWNNHFQKIDNDREYRGQWTSDRKTWAGIGEIKYGDGQLY